ncbi:MAG: hypothetical protein KIT57_10485 [Blastocatellales bacterium]|nr:hypothetical protein [Blastocatellales bacterium]
MGRKLWANTEFPREELLAHVARYLDPEEAMSSTARLWAINPAILQSVDGLCSRGTWKLHLPGGKRDIEFIIEDIRLSLFSTGVGFVGVAARPSASDLDSWLDFIHYFRFIGGYRDVNVSVRRRIGREQWEDVLPRLAGGAFAAEGAFVFGRLVKELLKSANLDSGTGDWWREVFVSGQMMPYNALLLDGVDEVSAGEYLYRLQNLFHARQEIHPGPDDLSLTRPSLLPYAKNQWFTFSLEGGSFLAINPPETEFFRKTLPEHLRRQYFLLFLLAAQQRFALMMLSEEVVREWKVGANEAETITAAAFERIRSRLLSFTARGYFLQVMQREHHHRCYRKWQEVFQIERLYGEVSDEVHVMHNYLLLKLAAEEKRIAEEEARRWEEERRRAEIERERAEHARQRADEEWRNREAREREAAERLERILAYLGAFVAGPTLVLTYFSINLHGVTAADEGLTVWGAIGVIGLAIISGLIAYWVVRRLIARIGKSTDSK